ncbi:hypothetical protein H0E84_08905 [Luteimonas sp. SJ-92]|uniref:CN hydrolase domain-containing protein n=1 Tax=Luteimonas salinisoli TaxID=2752307 RepID=A0A853JCM9_9GAMM|nr:hypothetical protein [Luteimonas salinisoli]NZA26504.1 hypothetical protein [Luteimonas salinisoli]
MPYDQVQFLGHAINTGPARDPTNNTYAYVGRSNVDDDIRDRIARVRSLLQVARDEAAPDAGILKVMMLPEFYFRGPRGAYTLDQALRVVEGLQALVQDEQWRDWFFAFGSVIAYSYAGDVDPMDDNTEPAEVYNIVPCQIGGYGQDAADAARVVMKEKLSGIDFISSPTSPDGLRGAQDYEAFLLDYVSHLDPMSDIGVDSEVQFVNYGGEGVFKACGFTWGVEVCLDHALGRLQQSSNLPKIAFQLIPSCGMSIKGANIALQTGWVFNVDGLNRGRTSSAAAPGPAHTELLEVVAGNTQSLDPVRVALATLDVAGLYAHGAGELHVYPPQPAIPS